MKCAFCKLATTTFTTDIQGRLLRYSIDNGDVPSERHPQAVVEVPICLICARVLDGLEVKKGVTA